MRRYGKPSPAKDPDPVPEEVPQPSLLELNMVRRILDPNWPADKSPLDDPWSWP